MLPEVFFMKEGLTPESASHKCSFCDVTTSNLNSSVHFHFFPILHCLVPVFFSFNSPVWGMAFSWHVCLQCHNPRVAFPLLMMRLVVCGHYLMKLPVEELSSALGSPTPLSVPFRASLCCSVNVVQRQALHGIALISWNKSKVSFTEILFFFFFWPF